MTKDELLKKLKIIKDQISDIRKHNSDADFSHATDLAKNLSAHLQQLRIGAVDGRSQSETQSASGDGSGGSGDDSDGSGGKPRKDRDENSFTGFFTDLGKGMIDAQRILDNESERYLKEIRGKRFIQPTVFRVPKLSGTLNVSLSRTKQTGLDMFVFEKKSQQEDYQEQHIQFEMTAAPPPVDALQELQTSLPDLRFVLSETERHQIFSRVQEVFHPQFPDAIFNAPNQVEALRYARKALTDLTRSEQDKVLIVESNQGVGYYLAAVSSQPGTIQGEFAAVWLYTPSRLDEETKKDVLTQIARTKRGADISTQKQILEDFIDRQLTFFNGVRPGKRT